MSEQFEDIRPFNDDEYHQVVNELIQVEPLIKAIQYYLPSLTLDQVKEILNNFETIQEFQADMACRIVQSIIDMSMEGFSYEGVTDLDKSDAYLLMSNHRDIVLDSALVNYCLNDKNYNTCEIAIGSNLLAAPWIEKLVRLNKSFIVKRNIPKQEMLEASRKLSSYIDHALKVKKQSVWIAQREGRSKDGNDKTNPGLLKMFGLCAEGRLLDHLMSLNITPISISYELDPCDGLKIPELKAKSKGEEYVKGEGEDNLHMELGMNGKKGRTHVAFCGPINDRIAAFSHIKNKNELLKAVAEVINHEIYRNYKLWESNYIAYDLLHDSFKYRDKYNEEKLGIFQAYMNQKLSKFVGDDEAKRLFLTMYANPVINVETV